MIKPREFWIVEGQGAFSTYMLSLEYDPDNIHELIHVREVGPDPRVDELVEALRQIQKPPKPAPDPRAHSWEAFGLHLNGQALDMRMLAARALAKFEKDMEE